MAEYLYWGAMLLAVMLSGLSKGGLAGLGMLATPVMALVMPPLQAAAIMLPILVAQDVFSMWSFRASVAWDLLKVLLPGAVIGIFGAVGLAQVVEPVVFVWILGLISLAFGLFGLVNAGRGRFQIRRAGLLLGASAGALAGLTSAIAHAGAPPVQIYLLSQKLSKNGFVATTVFFFGVTNVLKLPAYMSMGLFTVDSLRLSAILMPAAIGATFLGILVVRWISAERFVTFVHVSLCGVGLVLIYRAMV